MKPQGYKTDTTSSSEGRPRWHCPWRLEASADSSHFQPDGWIPSCDVLKSLRTRQHYLHVIPQVAQHTSLNGSRLLTVRFSINTFKKQEKAVDKKLVSPWRCH